MKWIYIAVLLKHLLSGSAVNGSGEGFVFPQSSEEGSVGNLMRSYSSNWQTEPKFSSGSVKTIKTSYSSSSRSGSSSEPMVMKTRTYQTGSSGSLANAGSSSYSFQPSLFNEGFAPAGSAGGSYASASSSSSSSSGFQCSSQPPSPANGRLKCVSNVCQASCLPDYKFPTGDSSLSIGCVNGRWMVKSLNLNEVPACEPVCLPACKNKGICIAPGQCKCPQNFMGPTCQLEKKLCLTSPPLPANAKRTCTQSSCTVTCMKGYKFPDGSLSMNLQCSSGDWVPENLSLKLIPDCEPTCNPPCLNGGNCLSYNVCQCTKDFRGAQCQWGTERCATTKMTFNGGFSCSGSADSLTCKITCPKGVNFDFPPAESYTCTYATGEFIPKRVPRCVFPPGMQVVQSKPVMQYSQTNGTLIKKGGGKTIVVSQDSGEDEEIEETQTIIKKTIIRKKGKKTYTVDEDEEFFESPGVYSLYMSQDLEVTYKTPKPSICMTWNGNKIKTFDGVTYTHELICSHTLIQDYVDGTFNIILRSCAYGSTQPCPHALEVFIQSEQFTFENVAGRVTMFTTKKELPIPVQMTGLKVTRSGTDVRIVLEQIPITITWDSKKFVQIEASESIWNRTAGLCGTMDGIMSNDFMSKDGAYHKMASTFVDSWRALNMDKNKEKCIPQSQAITSIACETSIEEKANLVCADLLRNPKMKNCFKMFNEDILMKNCISDYCTCNNAYERTECICNGISVLAKDCRFRGAMLEDGWRDWQICPLNCTNGRVYKSCGPLNEPSCGSAIENDSFNCREGCFCPEGHMLNDDAVCVKQEHCPCKLKGKVFPPKSQIKRDCNTCTCEQGNWKCTAITCGARCAAIGDPHYSTFDGKRYDFMGKCSYVLMKTEEISIEAENVACSGAISENMNFLPSMTTELPSCTKSLTIKFNDDAGQLRTIKLKQGGFVLLDGFEVSKLPKELSNGAVKIRQASSSFVIVDFMDGATVWWDGASRAYVDAPASYRGKTRGLCGTFNSNLQDDFLTPEGDIETTVHPFANKWQTKDSCDFLNDKIVQHPCQANVENKAKAEKICSKLREKVFEDCHLFVDPEEFYEDCMYDVCSCKGDVSQCFCPIFASYAAECARQGSILEWRYQVSECAITCPNGQVFSQCGEACTRTCSDLQNETACKLQCVEGCRCPLGQVLDENNECVTIAMCKCAYKGLEFKPHYKEVRPGRKFLELCTCNGGRWLCVEATGDDSIKYPAAGDISKKCSATRNEVFTTCEPAEPLTCRNMHLNISSTTALCRPGCKCKDGFVLDTLLKQCVLPEQCSCHHGGKSFAEGEQMKEDCNTCFCKGGKWECSTKSCASTCSVFGDSHFTTFDGREFDFNGVCSYVLSKGKLIDGDGFTVTIQSVLCGSNGVTCSKSLEINLVGNEPESIAFSSDLPVPGIKSKLNAKPLKKMLTYRSGVFIVVEIPHIGVLLKWDRGTRVYLKLENRWKGKVQGLCGNYNYDSLDDFLNPSLGVESNPIIFGHSWKLEDSCAIPTEQLDSCTLNPQRKTWAQRKCGLLKSSDFASCHSEVSVDSFYKRCIFDSCSCDQGGDCECLCTALSAYAFACAAKGVFIKWRTPDLCPMQCDPTCSNYHPCISPCPVETCDNLMHQSKSLRLCNADVCVEGCKLKECPEGSVYSNSSYSECVPKSVCKPICLEENGITYFENEIMASDSCHSCKCTRGNKVCTGVPCSVDVPDSRDADLNCVTGWTEWINQDVLAQVQGSNVKSSKSNYFKEDDIEPLPNNLQMKNMAGVGKAVCSSDYFAAIECRTVVSHNSPKKTGQNVECSLERGLVCKGQCFDFEIRVYCECGDTKTSSSPKPLPIIQPPQVPIVPVATLPTTNYITICDPAIPNVEHPLSCTKFLQCVMSQNGSFVYTEKTCGDTMMFNPKAMVCDWPASVQAIKPNCGLTPTEKLVVQRVCPPGFVWSECAVPCNRACNYYKQQLRVSGNCTMASNDCIPGCLPVGSALTCDYPKLWRDWKSCVDLQACTCVGPMNEILKPGQVVYVSDCKTCQCLNNEYICANVPCAKNPTTLQPLIVSSTMKTVEASKEIIGLPSYIRICNPGIPHVEHPNSCYKFLHCQPAANGSFVYAVKTCYPDMMFNPTAMVCDWPASVKAMKPSCGVNPGEIEIWETEELIIKRTRTSHYPSSSTQRTVIINSGSSASASSSSFQYSQLVMPSYIKICNPAIPHVEHPNSCYKFLHCQPATNGSFVYAVKTCYPDMMFNPTNMICDWPASVKAIKPQCGVDAGEVEIWETEELIIKRTKTSSKIPSSTQRSVKTISVTETFICDPTVPIMEDTESCSGYIECLQKDGTFILQHSSCGSVKMFNPVTKRCELPEEVFVHKPDCRIEEKFFEIFDLKTVSPIIIPSTLTPPSPCTQGELVPLLNQLPDSSFTASSILGNAFKPEFARLDPKPTDKSGGWSPKTNDLNQYLQITFPQAVPIHAVIIRGSKMFDQYVTSFKILHSYDGNTYHVHENLQKKPEIFSGSVDSKTPVKSIFNTPIEAKIIRIYPITWHGAIALRAELLGCLNPSQPLVFTTVKILPTTTQRAITNPPIIFVPTQQVPMFTEAPLEPLCDDPLGVENSALSPSQIEFSSIKDSGSVKTKVKKNPLEIIKLSSARGWMPLVDSLNEFVLIDFLDHRKLTGVITKGGEYGWVKSFLVLYSKDKIIWNIVSDNLNQPIEFLGNVDSDSVKKNLFKTPINAQFMKISPTKWHGAIELKLEPLGCFKPYPKVAQTTGRPKEEFEIVTPSSCGVCKGVLPPRPVDANSCICYPPLYWSGSECVPKTQCPCVEGHMAYEIGESYQTENCLDCVCKIGGVADCKPKVCPPCGKGLRRESPLSCSCKCIKCPEDEILCPTSGECIPESSWCDGVQDCPDDEKNCLITERPHVFMNRTETLTITKKCPDPNCPPGFVVKEKKAKKAKMSSRFSDSSEDDEDDDDKPQHQFYYIKAKYQASYEAILPISTNNKQQVVNSEECFEFMCVPIVDEPEPDPDYSEGSQRKLVRCPEPKCPRGYMIRLEILKTAAGCAKFTCEPITDNDAVCNVTGRTFNTFDSTEFKYDICSHLLARDVADAKWNVIMRRNCSGGNNICSKEIEIKDKVSKYTLILFPSLNVKLDEYFFTVEQLQNSNRKMSFTVSKNGDNLLYVSHAHGIWLTFDQYGDVKLGISSQYSNQVDGLCGFFNKDKSDDKRTPSGVVAPSTVDFGNSWSVGQLDKADCEPHVCPKALQDAAWSMCNMVKDDVFKSCHLATDPTRFISKCLETACDCLLTAANGTSTDIGKFSKECKCSMLKNYVVECLAADETVHLETWRSVHSCEASCPAPFVHHDCFRRKCETTCSNLQSSECTTIPGTCFSGCYCPSGTVKKDATCIPISECRDCVCDGFGKSQYLTYDRKNFTFDGNCTYLLTRDLTLQNIHTFQVYATVGACDGKSKSQATKLATCTQAFHLVYGNHIVHIQKSSTNVLEIMIDGLKLKSLPYNQNWIKIAEQGKTLNILLPESQVELTSIFESMTFSIKVPSVKYGSKMEGICGNCNGNPDDDLITNPAATNVIPENSSKVKSFALSWLANEPKLALNENRETCYIDDEADCLPLPPETDPCFKILDETIFGKCHFVVDPIMYVTACQQDLCRTGPSQKGSCETVAAYARECAVNGVCVEWRTSTFCTMDCTAPFVYNPCGCAETCKTIEDKEKLISSSTALKDPANIAKLRSICSAPIREGCFCPKGLVLHSGKCLRELECRACDDKGHLPGDVWYPDVCTSCSCRNDSTIQCQKIQCPSQQTICEIGYTAVETSSTGECCKKFACVPEIKAAKQTSCPQLALPKCGLDQTNKIINGTDGCSKFICDCVPKSQCKPIQNYTSLEPGMKNTIDTKGCCPSARLECDKSLCPPKPAQCSEAFFVLEKTKSSNDKICCDEYKCRPPSNNCIATVGGKKMLKKVDETWMTENVCEKAVCAFDTNGSPVIKAQREVCNVICQPGYELQSVPNKCCGVCIKTKCVVDNKLYEIGAEWMSDDNCTTNACAINNGQVFVATMKATCPDVSSCAPAQRYSDGCCEKCKLEPLSQHNCLPESMAESETIGLIRTSIPPHGNCKNINSVRGITQCSGTCRSGTKFDPLTLHQIKDCDCCSPSGVREIPVELLCDDKYEMIKLFNVPSSCSCSRCEVTDSKLLKLTAAS